MRDGEPHRPAGSTPCSPSACSSWSSRSCGCCSRRSSPRPRCARVPPTWWPETSTLDNYRTLFTQLDFPTYFFNSAIVALAVTVGNMVFCSMLGYALAKLDFPGKRLLFALVLGTLMVPGVVTFVPLFVLTTKIGLTNTLPGHDPAVPGRAVRGLPDAAVHPGLPDELIQAARIDGAGELRIFFSVDPAAVRAGPGDARRSSRSSPRGTTSSGRSWWPRPRTSTRCPVALALYAVGQNATQYGLLLAGLGRRGPPRPRRLPVPAAPHHARHRHDRHQVDRHPS